MKLRSLLLLTSFLSALSALSASCLFTLPTVAQNDRTQAKACVNTYQGELEDSDGRMDESNAPYDLINFSAKRGENLYLRLESTAFPPQVALFQVTDSGHKLMEVDHSPYDDRSEVFPWIYEDGNYAVRITPSMFREPGDPNYTDSERPYRGYYTLQISPVPCS